MARRPRQQPGFPEILPSPERQLSGEEGSFCPKDAIIDPQHDHRWRYDEVTLDRRYGAGVGCTFPSWSGVLSSGGRKLVPPRSPLIILPLEAREFRRHGRWVFVIEFT